MDQCLFYRIVGCLLFRDFNVLKSMEKTVRTFRIVHYFVVVCCQVVSINQGSSVYPIEDIYNQKPHLLSNRRLSMRKLCDLHEAID